MRKIHLLSYITLIVSYIGVFTVLYWLLYPYKIADWKQSVYKVFNKTVKQGGILIYSGDYCKYYPVPATISRSFADGIVFQTPESTANNPVGCRSMTAGFPIPKELPPGDYVLRTIYKFEVNPIRTIIMEHDTEKFTVIE